MLDLDYSDSDASDSEQQQTPIVAAPTPAPAPPPLHAHPKKALSGLAALLPKPKSRKQKGAADPDNDAPRKLIINLPKFTDEEEEERPTKKARTGGSGLSALLPAPKRTGAARKEAPPPPPPLPAVEEELVQAELGSSVDAPEKKTEPKKTAATGSNTMFVPQSVARKPIQPMSAFRKKAAATGASGKARAEPATPQISLFGAATATPSYPRAQATRSVPAGEYKPIMLEAAQPLRRPKEGTEGLDETSFQDTSVETPQQSSYSTSSSVAQNQQPQDLDALVRETGLNLDEHAMRQLYGRRGPGQESIKFSTFSVDEEYRQNELDREANLAQEVKPVRTVAPGRHQLQSLLNVAQSQRSALEDSFARGKQNRKESSSRYGW